MSDISVRREEHYCSAMNLAIGEALHKNLIPHCDRRTPTSVLSCERSC